MPAEFDHAYRAFQSGAPQSTRRGKAMKQATQPKPTRDDLQAAGYSIFEADVPTGNRYATVWERLNADEDGWDYVISTLDRGRERILNFEKPLTYAPHVVAIGELMIEAKIFRKKPALSFEYAICVNGSNDYEGNFATQDLRDRAIDELMLSGEISARNEDDVTRFTIEANGDQQEERGASLSLWLRDSKCIAGLTGSTLELRLAILIDDTDMAEKAIDAGADPHRATASGLTEFHRAAKLGRVDIIDLMGNIDDRVNTKGPAGNTPLHLAAEGDHAETCGRLYGKGASIDITNDAGETPYDISRRSHNQDIQRLFSSMQARHVAEQALKELGSQHSP